MEYKNTKIDKINKRGNWRRKEKGIIIKIKFSWIQENKFKKNYMNKDNSYNTIVDELLSKSINFEYHQFIQIKIIISYYIN